MWCTRAKARTLALLQLPAKWMALLTDDPLEAGVHVLPGGGLRPDRLLQRYGLPLPADAGAQPAGGNRGHGGGREPQQWRQKQGDSRGRASVAQPAGPGGGDDDSEEDDVRELLGDDDGGDDGGGESEPLDEEDRSALAPSRLAGRWRAVAGFRPTGWSFRKRKGGLACWRLGAAAVYGVPYSEHSSFAGAHGRPGRNGVQAWAGTAHLATVLVGRALPSFHWPGGTPWLGCAVPSTSAHA